MGILSGFGSWKTKLTVTTAEGAVSTCALAAAMGEEKGAPLRSRSHCLFLHPQICRLIAKVFACSILFCFLGTESLTSVRWQYLALHTLLRSLELPLNLLFL